MDQQTPNTSQAVTMDRDMGKRFLLVVGLILELIMTAAGLWPAVWLVLRFGAGSSSVAVWILVILGAVLAFNYGYLLALLAFRMLIPYPPAGLHQLGPDGRPPPAMLLFMLNTLLLKARSDPPWAAMFSSVLTRVWPLRPLYRRYFGPRTSSTTLGDTVEILDPYLVEAGRNVQFGFGCLITGHHFDSRGLYLATVEDRRRRRDRRASHDHGRRRDRPPCVDWRPLGRAARQQDRPLRVLVRVAGQTSTGLPAPRPRKGRRGARGFHGSSYLHSRITPMIQIGRHGASFSSLAAASVMAVAVAGCFEPWTNQLSWRNAALQATWTRGESALTLSNPHTGQSLEIPVGPTELEFDSGKVSRFEGAAARPMVIAAMTGETWRFSWPARPIPGSRAAARCRTSFEFDKASPWIRKRVVLEIEGADRPVLLKELVLDDLDVKGLNARQPFDGWQSYPVLCDSFYAGVEFPAAQAVVHGDVARLSCKPGLRLSAGQSYHAKSTVYGVCPASRSREAFEGYIASLRPESPPMHIQYNSWWSAPYPFTEKQMLDIAQVFQQQYHEAYGGPLDSFCLDMGWARSQSMWQIDKDNFPQGFKPLNRALGKMGTAVSLWTSPSSCYPYPGGLDSEWAMRNGYETFKPNTPGSIRYACLAGPKYADGFRDALVGHARKYKIAHYKFDGYQPMCPERDHGHEPGELSAEKTAEGFIATCLALRKANPDIWMEATCFGFKPSPWWLAYVNSVIGTFGDDAPGGRVPCPIYRESYTTARDFFNLQGARDILMPIYAQEVLGIIHQTPEPLQNDAVVCVLRGHNFIPLYVNPTHMTPRRWRFLANLMTWSRRNADLLAHTTPIRAGDWNDEKKSRIWEQSIPRDPYGYAHFDRGRGLFMVRNPWIKPCEINFKPDESIGIDKTLANAPLTCLYPRFGRLPGTFSYGQSITIDLQPYETRLIAFGGYPEAPALPTAQPKVIAANAKSEVSPEHRVHLTFEPGGDISNKQLWLLCEAKAAFQRPESHVLADGKALEARVSESTAGWRAGRSGPEEWTWLIFDLPAGTAKVEAEFQPQDDVTASAWLIGKEVVADDPAASGPISPPEERFLAAVELMAPVAIKWPEPANKTNVALASEGAKATASSIWADEHSPDKAIDGNAETRWNSAAGEKAGAWLAVDLGKPRTISQIAFNEAAGGRITSYKLQIADGEGWKDLIAATKPANQTAVRHRFAPVETSRIRLLVVAADEVPTIYEIEVK